MEVHLGVQWEAIVYMPGSSQAEPVILYADRSAGVADAVSQAQALVDQRITAAMTIMLKRTIMHAHPDQEAQRPASTSHGSSAD